MTTYLINHLRIPGGIPTEDELAYLEQVEAAVAPYDGKWLAIDAQVQVVEGAWPGSVVLMEFPDMAKAKEWYDSADYQKILPRRTTHSISDLVLVDGVGRASRPPASPSGSGRPSREPPGTAVTGPRLSRRALEEAQEGNRCFRGSVGSRVLSWLGETVVLDKRPICSCCRSPNGNGHAPPLPTTTRWVIPASSPILSEEGGAQPSG